MLGLSSLYNFSKINNIDNLVSSSAVRLSKPVSKSYKYSKSKDLYTHSKPNQQKLAVSVPFGRSYSPQLLLKAYSDENYVKSLISKNPELQDILQNSGLTEIYPQNITHTTQAHLMTTTANAMRIANEMGISIADKKILEQACVFHDFGKILLPEKILNKPDKLNREEKAIIDMHAELGYQLLSKSGMNKRVLELIIKK